MKPRSPHTDRSRSNRPAVDRLVHHSIIFEMKGTQTVIAGHSFVRWSRGTIQGYSEPDFDLPSSDADFINDEAEELLPLVEVQSIYVVLTFSANPSSRSRSLFR